MLAKYPRIRLGIYLAGIGAQIASLFAPVYAPELAQPLSQTADVLGALALGTAATNLTPAPVVYTEADSLDQLDPKHRA